MKPISSPLRTEDGATLIIGLLSLAFLTVIGIFATTTSTIETRAAVNDRNAKAAFYAAEMALTTGEAIVETLLERAELDESSTPGHFGEGANPEWNDTVIWTSDSVEVPSSPSGLTQHALAPRYTIEQRRFKRDSLTIGIGVPTGIHHFNVMARGQDRGSRTQSVLQTIYAKRFR